jgi:hypothetical protein
MSTRNAPTLVFVALLATGCLAQTVEEGSDKGLSRSDVIEACEAVYSPALPDISYGEFVASEACIHDLEDISALPRQSAFQVELRVNVGPFPPPPCQESSEVCKALSAVVQSELECLSDGSHTYTVSETKLEGVGTLVDVYKPNREIEEVFFDETGVMRAFSNGKTLYACGNEAG